MSVLITKGPVIIYRRGRGGGGFGAKQGEISPSPLLMLLH